MANPDRRRLHNVGRQQEPQCPVSHWVLEWGFRRGRIRYAVAITPPDKAADAIQLQEESRACVAAGGLDSGNV